MSDAYNSNLSPTKRSEDQIFQDVLLHSQIGFEETDNRAQGRNRVGTISFDEADELFRSWINENDWPFDALIFDPRIFTFIFEKTSRLIANKPKARLIPREGTDYLGAKINNLILDYQWDQANTGGSMISKWAMMDMNARKYGAGFALCKWRYERDKDGKPVFDGPDMKVINNRDFAHDLSATSIESSNWVQIREYITFQELERVNDAARGKPVYKNLKALRETLGRDGGGAGSGGGDTRSTNWTSRHRAIAGLELDPVGKDNVFKTVEIVTEYRKDRWITIAPKHGVVLRDIENPYKNYEIPVTMLRYYAIDDDLYGLSEIEPVKGPMKAINALVCQYIDEITQNLYSPIAIGPGVKQHTLGWEKGARWMMNNPMTDFRVVEGKSNAAQYFNTTYSVLVSMIMNALGESSLGVSNIQPFQNDKTATEVKALNLQRNARDNYNQIFLSEAIKRQLMLWHSMNQQMIFNDRKKQYFIVRIAGKDAIKYLAEKGLNKVVTDDKVAQTLIENPNLGGAELAQYPQYPINLGSDKEPKLEPKLQLEESGGSAKLYVEPEDLKGQFDFSVEIESMALSADDERKQAQQIAMSMLITNPNVPMLLAQEKIKPKFKELFIEWLEGLGFKDADRFFEELTGSANPMMAPAMGGGAPQMQMPTATPPQPQQPAGANQQEIRLNPPNPQTLNNLRNRFAEGGQIGA